MPTSERAALAVIVAYFGLHVVLRTAVSGSVQLDEAEQFLLAQEWSWGYGSQPPLYTWLQKAFIQVFGTNVFALALLKNLLLCGIYVLTYRAARAVFPERADALLAGAGLLLYPGLVWESQRDQTHLVLATMMAAATLCLVLRTFPRPSTWSCALLGLCGGLGLLTKYNFAIFLLALLGAALTIPAWRPGLLNRRMLAAAAVFLAVVTPHFYWAWTHPELTLSQSGKFQMRQELGLLAAWAKGTGQVVAGVLGNAAVPVVLFGLLAAGKRAAAVTTPREPAPPGLKLIWRLVLLGLGLSLVCVLAFQVTKVKARWLQPLMFTLPLLALAAARPRLTPTRRRIVLRLAVVVMVVVPAVMYGSVVAAGWTKRLTNLNVPYPALAAQVRQAGFTRGLILAENRIIGGNLKLEFPNSVVAVPELVPATWPEAGPILLAWKPGDTARPSAALLGFAASCGQTNLAAAIPAEAAAPSKYASWNQHRLGFAVAGPAAR